jgi:hypothetical protein
MMLGFERPRLSVKLGPRQAAVVEVSRAWWGRSRCWYGVADLPEGLVRPSPIESNISDPTALESHLCALLESGGHRAPKGQAAVLILPDLCVRATLLEMDAVPSRASERESLIRWRLQQEASFPVEGSKVVSQVLGPNTVLAAAIRETVLRQYEAVCEAVGLIPMEVDIASFRLWNMFAPAVPSDKPVAWLSLLDGGFSLIVFHAGRPTFLRTKFQTRTASDGVLRDLTDSLEVYAERHPEAPPRRLVLASEVPEPDLMARASAELGLEVTQAGWEGARRAGWPQMDEATPVGVLAAVAGLLGG